MEWGTEYPSSLLGWGLWDDQPSDQVPPDADQHRRGEKRDQRPDEADDGGVGPDVFCNPPADPAEHSVDTRTIQPFLHESILQTLFQAQVFPRVSAVSSQQGPLTSLPRNLLGVTENSLKAPGSPSGALQHRSAGLLQPPPLPSEPQSWTGQFLPSLR